MNAWILRNDTGRDLEILLEICNVVKVGLQLVVVGLSPKTLEGLRGFSELGNVCDLFLSVRTKSG